MWRDSFVVQSLVESHKLMSTVRQCLCQPGSLASLSVLGGASVSLITHWSKCQGSWKDPFFSGLLFSLSLALFSISACNAVLWGFNHNQTLKYCVDLCKYKEALKIQFAVQSPLCTWFKSRFDKLRLPERPCNIHFKRSSHSWSRSGFERQCSEFHFVQLLILVVLIELI